jgi:hypothetical protein
VLEATVAELTWLTNFCFTANPQSQILCNRLDWQSQSVLEDVHTKGPIRRTREGGSEWEPIKILLKGDEDSNKMNMASKSRLRLNYPSCPRPRNHWSATGPRNQQPPSRTQERNRTTTRALLTYTGRDGEHH